MYYMFVPIELSVIQKPCGYGHTNICMNSNLPILQPSFSLSLLIARIEGHLHADAKAFLQTPVRHHPNNQEDSSLCFILLVLNEREKSIEHTLETEPVSATPRTKSSGLALRPRPVGSSIRASGTVILASGEGAH